MNWWGGWGGGLRWFEEDFAVIEKKEAEREKKHKLYFILLKGENLMI